MPERDYYTAYPRPILWLVPGGEVAVGGPEPDAAPAFTAAVEPFYLSKLPVTNEQFEAFDPGYERSAASPEDRDPAVDVSWQDAVEYCAWYAEVARKPIRLPSEVEWEHACRAGTSGRWPFGDDGPGLPGGSGGSADLDDFLWHRGNCAGDRVPPLDGKRANGFGLHGMLGGVWEWTASVYRPYPLAPAAPPDAEQGAESEEPRVLRGGSFRTPLDSISSSLRRAEAPSSGFDDAGFRIARSFRT